MADLVGFVKKNLGAAVGAFAALLSIYLIKLTNLNIGIDTEFYMSDGTAYNHVEIGRFARVLLTKLWEHYGVNPYFISCFSFAMLVLGTLLWGWMLAKDREKISGIGLFVFFVAFGSSGVWLLQMYFTLQSAEVFIGVSLMVPAILLCFDGVRSRSVLKLAASACLVGFTTGIYQSFIMLFFSGAVAYYLMSDQLTKDDSREDAAYVVGTFLTGVAGFAVYALVNMVVLAVFTDGGGLSYLTDQVSGGGFIDGVRNLIIYCIELLFGNIPAVRDKFGPADPAGFGFFTVADPLLIVLVPIFWWKSLTVKAKSVVYYAAAALFPALILVFPIAGGGSSPLRSLYPLPIVAALVYWYAADVFEGRVRTAVICVLMASLFLTVQKQAFALYSDQIRFDADRKVAEDIFDEVARQKGTVDIQGEEILILGQYDLPIKRNYVYSEAMGKSLFFWDSDIVKNESTRRGVRLMRALGYDVTPVSDKDGRLKKLKKKSKKMPCYPADGWVKNIDGVYVVKLSK